MRDDVDSGSGNLGEQAAAASQRRPMLRGMELNKAIAERTGWTELFDAGGVLLGKPPCGFPHGRGQAMVPNWSGNWGDCGPLIAQRRIAVNPLRAGVSANNEYTMYEDDMDPDSAARHAIASAYLAQLMGRS